MEERVPALAAPSVARGRRFGRAAPLAVAPILVLVVAATVVAGGAAVASLVRGAPGVENPGQPLEGAALECKSPTEAAEYLTAHGFTNVSWQVETGEITGKVGTTSFVSSPPPHGFVVPGSIIDGQLLMIIDQRVDATGTGACPDEPMP
jgi:hypothetical protein